MQISSAFGQVQDSLSFIVTSYTEIAEYQSVVERLRGFRARVDEIADEKARPRPIAISRGGRGVAVEQLELRLPGGAILREEIALAARPDTPVLVTGPSG